MAYDAAEQMTDRGKVAKVAADDLLIAPWEGAAAEVRFAFVASGRGGRWGDLALQPCGAVVDGSGFVAECGKILAALGRVAPGQMA